MDNEEILNTCSDLLDKLTVVKGYLQLSTERKKVDYSLLLLQEINEIQILVYKMIDTLKK
ncbi:MAG: hypothetical protein A4E52_00622 [Pelotomaculum sp. PtaB.Bin013]|uniref:Histidine kinase n=1 Tax=Pelotomaculum isophthalicicum JI TaxID=947010 RepID=A0A9X4JVR3_9FIRM|nr:histidine kinase [Pelotomaculum isophthalicicum]MDF9407858.1 histidine kinase [Pelotomaculum isophthalicicum JI]OPX91065.1 MAG: hypothetical protein A4E52_00622 [Pelotomaculum sp. PtaB.Bin013]